MKACQLLLVCLLAVILPSTTSAIAQPGAAPSNLAPPPAATEPLPTTAFSASHLALALRPAGATFSSDKRLPSAGAGDNPFPLIFPELRRLPAPSWLKEGTRVTYRIESATIAQSPDATGSTGAGLMQYDLVALDDALALSSMKFYADTIDGASVVPSSVFSAQGIPGAGDYWINPQALQKAEDAASEKLAVVHMPTKIEGKTYNAVRFQYEDKGALYVWMFEEKTGLLLFYRHEIGRETDDQRQLSSMTFVRRRQLKLPWRDGARPDWAKINARLDYEGTYTVVIPDTPDSVLPYTTRAHIKRAGDAWCLYQLRDAVSGRANAALERVTGSAQLFDGLWLAPEALKALKKVNGVIDRDPATGAQTSVSHSRDGLTVLTESGDVYRSALTYNRDGALINVSQEIQNGITGSRVQLKLVKLSN